MVGTTTIIALAALVGGPLVSQAADTVEQTNEDTGNNSTNRNRARINRRHRHDQTNVGTAVNMIGINATTGKNKSNQNTTGGDINSGVIDVAGATTNELNQNPGPLPSPITSEVNATQTNDDTGNNSTNTNRLRVRERQRTTVNNTAVASNTINVTGNTGQNESNENTTGGTTTTGDVLLNLSAANILN
ncbi:MAG: hypothetical protein WEA04_03730 [Candidatus Andersenbacteria bacterium]